MGDRCCLEITLRRSDLDRFASHVHAQPGDKWFDDDAEHDNPDLVTVLAYEANYAWYDERMEAAEAGIPFFGTHGEGGDYGAFAFASVDGEQAEAPLNREGDLTIAVDENLQMIGDIGELRAYVNRLRAVKQQFKLEAKDGRTHADP